MAQKSFDDLLGKVKKATKVAADQTGRAAKYAKLSIEYGTLTTEKYKSFGSIGRKTFQLYTETKTIDGAVLKERIMSELQELTDLENKIEAKANEMANLKAYVAEVEIKETKNND